jgi:hypothetical protein
LDLRRSTTASAVFYPAAIVVGWAVVSLCGASHRVEASRAVEAVGRLAPSLAANASVIAAPPISTVQSAATIHHVIAKAHVISAEEIIAKAFPPAPPPVAPMEPQAAASNEPPVAVANDPQPTPSTEPKQPIVVASLGDPTDVLTPAVPAEQASASTGTADTPSQEPAPARPRIEIVGECLVVEPCIDAYLFALYERTPKEDTIKETTRRKVTIKRKGKHVTVTRSFTRLVDNNFTWKDPKAAERVNMSMIDYVIGGMDKSFKFKLFYMLQAAENAGLQPGITSAFRDDYRQGIASGLKAASDSSYHGGSRRGGYGKGLAADITSVKGANRAQRWVSTEALWKWVDANGKEYGIGRPYLGRDPPHVGPIDGPEYVSKRGGAKAADVKKRNRHAVRQKPAAAQRPVTVASQSERAG